VPKLRCFIKLNGRDNLIKLIKKPKINFNYMLYHFNIIPWWLLLIVFLWVLPWKGVALWQAARNNQKVWFVIFMLVNTMAFLEILYLLFWAEPKKK